MTEVLLEPWDVISFPPGLWRRFENASEANAVGFAVLDPHDAFLEKDPIWPEWMVEKAAEARPGRRRHGPHGQARELRGDRGRGPRRRSRSELSIRMHEAEPATGRHAPDRVSRSAPRRPEHASRRAAAAMPPRTRSRCARCARADRLITAPGGERAPADGGYEDTFTDIVDFILRVTHRIWEEKAIGYLTSTTRHNARVFQDDGIVYGRERGDRGHDAFDRRLPRPALHADDIVWCGDEDIGFWTSHRLTLDGHNTGWSRLGPADRPADHR